MAACKERFTAREGDERGEMSCQNVKEMFSERPWVVGEITVTKKDDEDDKRGIDLFVPFDTRLTDILSLEQDEKGVMVQVKSSLKMENEFKKHHRSMIMNISTGQNIFVFNGQEDRSLMLGTLIGQIVAYASLSDSLPEDLILEFMAENMQDPEAVEAYIDNRDRIIKDKWFGRWIRAK